MPLAEAQVIDALRPIEDPELRRSIVDLGMVTGVRTERKKVAVRVAVPVADYPQPSAAALAAKIKAAVFALDPKLDDVRVDAVLMTDEQRIAVSVKLGGPDTAHENAGHAGHGHAAGPEKALPFQKAGSRTRVLGICSGKGGVGKSSVTVNTAVTLARLGHRVAILDADVYGFSVPKMLGIDRDPLLVEKVIVPPVAHGVACISMGFFVPEDQAVMWRGPMLHKALEQFLTDVAWGELDYLVVDMPPGTGDVALSMAQYVPRSEVYIVTTPQPAAQRVAQRTASMAEKVNLPLLGIIENMSWFTGDDGKRYELFGSGGGQELSEKLGVPLIGQVPLVPDLREGGDVGLPVTVTDPGSEAALAFEQIAKHIEANGPKRIYRPELTIR